ncbi:MAG TPA: hypothetical protein DCW68_02775 [Rhodospirillaceae bacterium]|nr:MAG: hypothetical protein A2018_05750 [Alphaproteobacteria bacterium GWF2_58_20]HAU29019.1 hypothetical protein [Rhodospirillaceae bacterium]
MIDEIRTLVEQYSAWIKDKTVIRKVTGNWVEITTPFLDHHNDCLQIYTRKQEDNSFLITDDGYIISDLEMCGCQLTSVKRKEILKTALAGFGVRQNGKNLEIDATPDNFSLKKHNLIQAMLAVDDMFYLAGPTVVSLFKEDVAGWLDLNKIRYTPGIKFSGKSGFDHQFDFVIPKSTAQQERILRAINSPTKDAIQAMAFSWMDTRETRPSTAMACALLNDGQKDLQVNMLQALREYDILPIIWSEREKFQSLLAA